MAGLGGVRVVTNHMDESDELVETLQAELEVMRIRDWARAPRSSGYRALHLHVKHDGVTIEVQIRTFGQDAWANLVEEESRASGMNDKAEEGNADVLAFFRDIAAFYAVWELGESHPSLASDFVGHLVAARPS